MLASFNILSSLFKLSTLDFCICILAPALRCHPVGPNCQFCKKAFAFSCEGNSSCDARFCFPVFGSVFIITNEVFPVNGCFCCFIDVWIGSATGVCAGCSAGGVTACPGAMGG